MNKHFFKNKRIIILGGTGSIGAYILKSLIPLKPKLIRIFSRDEYKQHKLRYLYMDEKNIDYILGDIGDIDTLLSATRGFDVIFHCAALKHVSISEEMPEAFIKTNVIGSLNVKKIAILNKIPLTLSISSDKAVDPTNVMGLTKSLQEKIFSAHFLKAEDRSIKFITVRFGNVIGTHGSLFPILYDQIRKGMPITITNPEMTRFYMSPKEAIDLIFWGAINGNDGEIIIKKMKSAKTLSIIKEFLRMMKEEKTWPIRSMGIRVGEKMHEALVTEDNLHRTKEKDGYYIVTPYSPADITKDKIIANGVDLDDKNKFISNSKQNFLAKKEIADYITEFLENREQLS